MSRSASPLTVAALTDDTVTTLSNGLSAQLGFASAESTMVTVAPTGSVSMVTWSGLVPTTCHVTPGTSADTVTDGFVSQLGSAMSDTSMPRARNEPVFCTVIVKSTGVSWLAGTMLGAAATVIASEVV